MFPIKDYIYGGAILALLIGFGWYTAHERNIGKAHELAVLQESSQKLQAAAEAKVAALSAQHASEVSTIKVNYEAQHTADSLQHDTDTQRLRNFDAYRRQHEAMDHPATGPGAGPTVASGAVSDGERLTSLEQVALNLAAAGRSVSESLTACTADRAALAGK